MVVSAIRRFASDCTEFHNDSTSITLSGDYAAANGDPQRGQATLKVGHGHNKDHRPDLKQLLWILTVSADGAVPVHYRVVDGKTEDSQTHPAAWDILHRLAGTASFLWLLRHRCGCREGNVGWIAHNRGGILADSVRTKRRSHFS